MILMPHRDIENHYSGHVAGVDEAGRGPWAGPVVAASVVLRNDNDYNVICVKDSKKMTVKQREASYRYLIEHAYVGIGIATVEEIDAINILQATYLAMYRSIEQLTITPDMVLIDGNSTPKINFPCRAVVSGDSISMSIAAASIIAKVTRDHIMHALDEEYPVYGWKKNAGYGTKIHQHALHIYGASPHHRMSFAPLRRLKSA